MSIDAALDKGRKGGRPKALTLEKEAILKALVMAGNMSVTQICSTVGISRSVYYRAVEALR